MWVRVRLQEPRLVYDENRIRLGQGLEGIVSYHVTQSISVPCCPSEQSLLTPWPGVTRGFRSHPARLAPLRAEQSIEEQTGRGRHALLLKERPDATFHIPQRRRPRLQRCLDRTTCHRSPMIPESWGSDGKTSSKPQL